MVSPTRCKDSLAEINISDNMLQVTANKARIPGHLFLLSSCAVVKR
jgi:hypothetical protein